ncbi:hypothetical protein F0562_034780 [Nyssa sinensis]|uniref:Uncharacterized protein n=1 Tax=Nyssa sinensis TaxID=561372 RepID=A0A5J5A8Y1_9ASTE|nr:hypothetical protein F0562_034780 [Nyssa sinensis]
MTEIIPGLQGDVPANYPKGVPFVDGKQQRSRLPDIKYTLKNVEQIEATHLEEEDTIDFLQGHYIVSVSRDMTPASQKGGLEAFAQSALCLESYILHCWIPTCRKKGFCHR